MQAGGWDGDRTSLLSKRVESNKQAQAVLDADIVVFHRPNDWRSLEIAKKLREQGKKIVADNDDTYKHLDGKNLEKALAKVDKGLDTFCEFADLVTTTTQVLADEYKKLNPNTVILPNCVDPDVWPEPLKNDTDKVRLGFVGSVASNSDYDNIKDVLAELSKRDDVQIVVFGLPHQMPDKSDTEAILVRDMYKKDYDFWQSLNIDWHPFVPVADYIDTLNSLKLDIMVIPRKDDYFNRCKSNLKFLEASMLEIPCVVQGFTDELSPYQVNPEDRKYCDIVVDNNDWMKYLEPLIASSELRKKRGQEAYKYVVENYSIENKIHLWETQYKKLLE
jgi:glycosyltransferase involved in cell wall biosynthesis